MENGHIAYAVAVGNRYYTGKRETAWSIAGGKLWSYKPNAVDVVNELIGRGKKNVRIVEVTCSEISSRSET